MYVEVPRVRALLVHVDPSFEDESSSELTPYVEARFEWVILESALEAELVAALGKMQRECSRNQKVFLVLLLVSLESLG